jgi:hypothetical protein
MHFRSRCNVKSSQVAAADNACIDSESTPVVLSLAWYASQAGGMLFLVFGSSFHRLALLPWAAGGSRLFSSFGSSFSLLCRVSSTFSRRRPSAWVRRPGAPAVCFPLCGLFCLAGHHYFRPHVIIPIKDWIRETFIGFLIGGDLIVSKKTPLPL